jgi:ElaB/YqjD/DUF883 family membrane-anchored ribosome-binding protein
MGEEPTPLRPADPLAAAPATPAGSDSDTEAIRADIAETRAEMSETIDAIQERLSPQRLMDDAKQNVRDATVGKVTTMMNTVTDKAAEVGEQVQDQAQQAVTYVRDNPIPALLIGAGVTWLLMRSRGGGRSYSGYSDYGGRSTYRGYAAGGRYRVREDMPASATGQSWTEAAGDTAERMQRRVSEYGRSAETTLERWLRENPLTVGTVALAAGAVVGLGLPRTQTEDAWMGEARDTLVERAQETAQQAVEKVGEVAGQVQQSAGEVRSAADNVGEQLGGTTPASTSTSTASTQPAQSTQSTPPRQPSLGSPTRTRTSGTGGA